MRNPYNITKWLRLSKRFRKVQWQGIEVEEPVMTRLIEQIRRTGTPTEIYAAVLDQFSMYCWNGEKEKALATLRTLPKMDLPVRDDCSEHIARMLLQHFANGKEAMKWVRRARSVVPESFGASPGERHYLFRLKALELRAISYVDPVPKRAKRLVRELSDTRIGEPQPSDDLVDALMRVDIDTAGWRGRVLLENAWALLKIQERFYRPCASPDEMAELEERIESLPKRW